MWLRNLNSKQHDPNVSSHSTTWYYPISSVYSSLESPNKAQILSLNKHTRKTIQYLKRRVFCRESEAGREIKIFFCRRRAFKKKNLFFLLISLTLQFYGSSHVSDNRKTERHGDRNAKFMKLKNLKFPPTSVVSRGMNKSQISFRYSNFASSFPPRDTCTDIRHWIMMRFLTFA